MRSSELEPHRLTVGRESRPFTQHVNTGRLYSLSSHGTAECALRAVCTWTSLLCRYRRKIKKHPDIDTQVGDRTLGQIPVEANVHRYNRVQNTNIKNDVDRSSLHKSTHRATCTEITEPTELERLDNVSSSDVEHEKSANVLTMS